MYRYGVHSCRSSKYRYEVALFIMYRYIYGVNLTCIDTWHVLFTSIDTLHVLFPSCLCIDTWPSPQKMYWYMPIHVMYWYTWCAEFTPYMYRYIINNATLYRYILDLAACVCIDTYSTSYVSIHGMYCFRHVYVSIHGRVQKPCIDTCQYMSCIDTCEVPSLHHICIDT
jgi:hypothetical protein